MNLSINKNSSRLISLFWQSLFIVFFLSLNTFAQTSTLNFLYVSDFGGKAGKEQKSVASAMGKEALKINAKFVVTGGDNYHDNGIASENDIRWKTEFEDVYNSTSLQIPWYASLGNHDYLGNAEAEVKHTALSVRWKLPSRYYSQIEQIDSINSILIVHIDTPPFLIRYQKENEKYHVAEQNTKLQMKWLDSVLSNTKATWKVVVGHHPIYSAAPKHGDTNELIENILPILIKNNVKVYFCGHDHILQDIHTENIEFLVAGGGAKFRDVSESPNVVFGKGSLGFLSLSVTPEILSFRFIDSEGVILHSGNIKSH